MRVGRVGLGRIGANTARRLALMRAGFGGHPVQREEGPGRA